MAGSGEQQIVKLIKDTTLRWSCRRGDYVLWLQFTDPIAEQSLGIVDLWEMRDGDFVTVTNRPEDLPASFELHPTEVRDALAYQMAAKLEKGYQPPDEPAEGPNIWRLKSGDRMAWVGNRVEVKKPLTEYWQFWTAGNVVWPSEKPTEAASRILWRSVRHRSLSRVPKIRCVARLR